MTAFFFNEANGLDRHHETNFICKFQRILAVKRSFWTAALVGSVETSRSAESSFQISLLDASFCCAYLVLTKNGSQIH